MQPCWQILWEIFETVKRVRCNDGLGWNGVLPEDYRLPSKLVWTPRTLFQSPKKQICFQWCYKKRKTGLCVVYEGDNHCSLGSKLWIAWSLWWYWSCHTKCNLTLWAIIIKNDLFFIILALKVLFKYFNTVIVHQLILYKHLHVRFCSRKLYCTSFS